MGLNLRTNTLWALGEVVISSLVLFLLYKIVVAHLGVAALGIWSLVLATTSLGRLADIGTAAGLGRFVAAAEARQESERALFYAETAILTNFCLYVAIALMLAIPAYYGLALAIHDGDALAKGRQLLPYSLASLVLMSVTSATTGALVGQHRSDQKSMMTLIGLVVQFGTAYLFVPHYGLPGLAWAQIAQYAVLIMGSWFLFLRNHYKVWKFRLPLHWHKDMFRELIGFGMKLQVASIASMLYDPIVKFLMSSFGGLEMLGFFEMTQRLVLQIRQLVVMPNQTLVPTFAHLMESDPEKIGALYHKALSFSLIFGLPLMGGAALAAPAISYLWIGHIEPVFVIFCAILSTGWFLNLVSAPAFLMGVGTGHIRWNVYGALVTTGGVCGAGFGLGHLCGGYGVAVAASSMQAAGSLLSMIMNCRDLHIAPLPEAGHYFAARDRIMQFLKIKNVFS